MLDLGQGAWRRLMEAGVGVAELTGILVSHHHLDHIADLPALLFALNYDPDLKDRARLTLVGHAGLAQVLDGLAGVFGRWVQPPDPPLAVRWLAPGQGLTLGEVDLAAQAAEHMTTSLAYRLTWRERSLVYLGDSLAAPRLAELARGADLLVAHTAGGDRAPRPGHLNPAAAGRLAAEAGVGALLLSHFYGDVDPAEAAAAARENFGGPVWAAEDHLEISLGPGGASAERLGS